MKKKEALIYILEVVSRSQEVLAKYLEPNNYSVEDLTDNLCGLLDNTDIIQVQKKIKKMVKTKKYPKNLARENSAMSMLRELFDNGHIKDHKSINEKVWNILHDPLIGPLDFPSDILCGEPLSDYTVYLKQIINLEETVKVLRNEQSEWANRVQVLKEENEETSERLASVNVLFNNAKKLLSDGIRLANHKNESTHKELWTQVSKDFLQDDSKYVSHPFEGPRRKDAEELLEKINHMFTSKKFTSQEMIKGWLKEYASYCMSYSVDSTKKPDAELPKKGNAIDGYVHKMHETINEKERLLQEWKSLYEMEKQNRDDYCDKVTIAEGVIESAWKLVSFMKDNFLNIKTIGNVKATDLLNKQLSFEKIATAYSLHYPKPNGQQKGENEIYSLTITDEGKFSGRYSIGEYAKGMGTPQSIKKRENGMITIELNVGGLKPEHIDIHEQYVTDIIYKSNNDGEKGASLKNDSHACGQESACESTGCLKNGDCDAMSLSTQERKDRASEGLKMKHVILDEKEADLILTMIAESKYSKEKNSIYNSISAQIL